MPIPQLRGGSQFDRQGRLSRKKCCHYVDLLRRLKVWLVFLAPRAQLLSNSSFNRANQLSNLVLVSHRASRWEKSNGHNSRLRFQKYCTQASSGYLGSIVPASMLTVAQIDAPTFSESSVAGYFSTSGKSAKTRPFFTNSFPNTNPM